MKELKVVIHVIIDGEDHLWESLSKERKEEISVALNDRALRAIGYLPLDE